MENEYDIAPRKGKVSRPLALARLVLIVILLGLFIFCLWQGRFLALLAWVLTIVVMIDTSMNVLFGIYNEPRSWGKGLAYWVATLFLGALSTQVVTRKGEILPTKPAGPLASVFARLGAPSIVVIENGVAVAFERGGRHTQLHGPGIVFTQRHERIAEVIDLRRQVRSKKDVRQVMTRDGLAFDLDRLDAIFDLAADFDPRAGEYRYSEGSTLDLIFRGGKLYDKGQEVEWGGRVLESVEHHLRNVAAGHDLRELVQGKDKDDNPRQRFLTEVESRARPALQEIGVRLVGIDIGQLIVPPELQQALLMPVRQEAMDRISVGLREAIKTINEALGREVGEVRPHLLVNLTETLGRILEESLRLSGPAVRAPELLSGPAVEEKPPRGGEKPS